MGNFPNDDLRDSSEEMETAVKKHSGRLKQTLDMMTAVHKEQWKHVQPKQEAHEEAKMDQQERWCVDDDSSMIE
jgi:c-di-GMP-related signal transduction protein